MYENNPNAPRCDCGWQYAWHYSGPQRKMEEWECVLTEYRASCAIPQHAALAALLAPKPEPSGWHAEMRRRANDEREQAGLPREDEEPSPRMVSRYIDRLESKVAADGGYGSGVLDAYNNLHSHHAPTRQRGMIAAAKLLGDTK